MSHRGFSHIGLSTLDLDRTRDFYENVLKFKAVRCDTLRVKEGGQKPMDAIVSATSLAAESMGLGGAIGTLAAGMAADVIAVQGNPLDDITALRRVSFVMKGGKLYRH